MSGLPFICELCTVRRVLGRELDPYRPEDKTLLQLERMRLIDMCHGWAPATLNNYCRQIKSISLFRRQFQLPELPLPAITCPSNDDSIPLYWHMAHYTSQPSRRAKEGAPKFNSGRAFRSAYSMYATWATALCSPTDFYRNRERQLLQSLDIRPSDNIVSSLTAHGMSTRLGTHSTPSMALHHRHIRRNYDFREARFTLHTSALTAQQRYDLAAAQTVELFGWLGWLRAMECMSLRQRDVSLYPPDMGQRIGLPLGVGALLLRLLPATKSSQTLTADVIIAWTTSSGLSLGTWFNRLLDALRSLGKLHPDELLFQKPDGSPWTSHYYRHVFLYPLLRAQRDAGDPLLQVVDESDSEHTFGHYFYSFHSLRRGGNTHATRKRENCARKATDSERVLHGRWRTKNLGKEPMPLHYVEPSYEDRIWITLLAF